LAKFARFMPAAEVLARATSGNAELLALSGQRSPYPGPLGLIAAGAQADLLVLDADPLADIEIIGDPARMRLIMKAGAIVKDMLGAASLS
jgi:imidazolonepropionase-like amidohydrolase